MIGNYIKKIIMLLKSEKKVPIVNFVYNNRLLCGKVVLITGGSGGIGKAIAQKIVSSGGKVILTGRNKNKLIECCNSIADRECIHYCTLDLNDVSSLDDKIEFASKLFPDNKIDILINCAGIIDHTPFLQVSEDTFDKVMDTNIKGTFFVCQAVAKQMINKGIKGHILNISSSSAMRPASTPYNISKWSIRGFTSGLADVLLPYGIVVNAIGPGPTSTEMLGKKDGDSIEHPTNPSGRFVTPDEIANLAVLMISGMGDMIVGDTFYISGGSGTITMHK